MEDKTLSSIAHTIGAYVIIIYQCVTHLDSLHKDGVVLPHYTSVTNDSTCLKNRHTTGYSIKVHPFVGRHVTVVRTVIKWCGELR